MLGPLDPRDVQLAQSLLRFSVAAKPGELVYIHCGGTETLGLGAALVEATAKLGAAPYLHVTEPEIHRMMLRAGREPVFKRLAQFELKQMKDADCYIGIRGPSNSFETSDVPRENLSEYNRVLVKPVHLEERVKRTRWCVLRYPNPAMAQMAQMSTAGFADFYYKVCLVDYARMNKAAQNLTKLMGKTDNVRITGPGTDLEFSIKGIPPVPCCGTCNIPDGEVFTAPVRTSIQGYVQFNAPTLYEGNGFDGVRLQFEKGRVVEATASTPEQTLKLNAILDQDPGARYVGEFAIAFHPHILQPMRDILFDEKIAGSFHMALGQCYEDASNGNKSNIHWDLVCIQRPDYGGGEITFDGKVIRRDGIFLPRELQSLNPDRLG